MSNIQEEDLQFESGTDIIMPPLDVIAFNELRSCSDIYRMYFKHQLDINPDFQRNEVWSKQAQTRFIDSLVKGLPIPSMCISLDTSTQKRYVIDGLQRISSIIHFLDEKTWKMSNCTDVIKELSGKTNDSVRNDNPDLYDRLENATIPITVIRCDYNNPSHMEYLFNIFSRLNSGGCKLNNQEIRNCIYQGPFNTFIKEITLGDQWTLLRSGKDNNRHKEDELVLRFFALLDNHENYSGNMTSFLNRYMDEKRNLSEVEIEQKRNIINKTMNVVLKMNDRIKELGVTVFVSVLVGVAANILLLEDKDVVYLSQRVSNLLDSSEFSDENLQDGLSSKIKVQGWIDKSINTFGEK